MREIYIAHIPKENIASQSMLQHQISDNHKKVKKRFSWYQFLGFFFLPFITILILAYFIYLMRRKRPEEVYENQLSGEYSVDVPCVEHQNPLFDKENEDPFATDFEVER